MKKFLAKLCAFTLIIALIILPFNMLIDPYNVFHWSKPVNNGVEPNKNYIKTEYILHNPDKFDSFLFGSSRVGFLDPTQLTDGHYYNMNSSEAVPAEHLRILKLFAEHGIIPKHVIIMVDEISCFVDPAIHNDVLYRVPVPVGSPLEKLKFYMRYLDSYTTLDSLPVIKEHQQTGLADPDFLNRFYNTGNDRLDIPPIFTGIETDGTPTPGYWNDDYTDRIQESVEDIMELKAFCEAQGTQLTIMTTPTYHMTYQKAVEHGYLDFLSLLSENTDFYNFAGINDITTSPLYYFEASHFTPAVGNQMLEVIQGNVPDAALLSQGFGMHVTAENHEAYLTILRQQQ